MASYKPKGVCASRINFDIDESHHVRNVSFEGGCRGNATGISRLVDGRDVREIIETLKGITCGRKPTSCPAQLAEALASELVLR